MSSAPTEIQLTLRPGGRFDVIDVKGRVRAEFGDALARHREALYCSFHTTAGYLDPRLAARLLHHRDRLSRFIEAFGVVFPPGAAYLHDQMDLRAELSAEQREHEPANGDSHLTFIGARMTNCAVYRNREERPVYFIELDGVNRGTRRERTTSVVGYDREDLAARFPVAVPTSAHPIDAINLGDPHLGLFEAVDDALRQTGVEKGRVDVALEPRERSAGLTVNEYETLLMQHDLKEVLRDPLRFAAEKYRHIVQDPLAVPGKTISYAQYDVVRLLNSLIEAFGMQESALERLIAKAMALPAKKLLRARRVSFLASDAGREGRARLRRGTYQSPILVQWQAPEGRTRRLEVSVFRLT